MEDENFRILLKHYLIGAPITHIVLFGVIAYLWFTGGYNSFLLTICFSFSGIRTSAAVSMMVRFLRAEKKASKKKDAEK